MRVFSAFIFGQKRASTAMANIVNDLSTPICWKDNQLTYIVNESCIKCKLMDCVEVCPVDCF